MTLPRLLELLADSLTLEIFLFHYIGEQYDFRYRRHRIFMTEDRLHSSPLNGREIGANSKSAMKDFAERSRNVGQQTQPANASFAAARCNTLTHLVRIEQIREIHTGSHPNAMKTPRSSVYVQ